MKEIVTRGYKVKIYPTEEQTNKINQTFRSEERRVGKECRL